MVLKAKVVDVVVAAGRHTMTLITRILRTSCCFVVYAAWGNIVCIPLLLTSKATAISTAIFHEVTLVADFTPNWCSARMYWICSRGCRKVLLHTRKYRITTMDNNFMPISLSSQDT